MPEAPEVKWVLVVVVIGALYMSKTKSTRHLGRYGPSQMDYSKGHEERITADGVRFAQHNATRYANQTYVDRLYENISNLNPWNASAAKMSREDEKKLWLKMKQGL